MMKCFRVCVGVCGGGWVDGGMYDECGTKKQKQKKECVTHTGGGEGRDRALPSTADST